MKNFKLQTAMFFMTYILVQNISAQEYEYMPMPTSNAIWSEYVIDYTPGAEYPHLNEKFVLFDTDTVVFGVACHPLYRSYDSIPTRANSELIGYLQFDGKKVYYCRVHHSDWFGVLLYDFDVQVGDTVIVDYPSYAPIRIYDIDTIMFNGKLRRRLHTDFEGVLDVGIKWIEGVGSTNGLLWPGDYSLNAGLQLLCLHHNSVLQYYNGINGNCYLDLPNPNDTTSVFNAIAHRLLHLYPNPVSDILYAELPKVLSGTLRIFAQDGRLLLSKNIVAEEQIEIDVKPFDKGLYFLSFESSDEKQIITNKFQIN